MPPNSIGKNANKMKVIGSDDYAVFGPNFNIFLPVLRIALGRREHIHHTIIIKCIFLIYLFNLKCLVENVQ